MIRRVQRRGEVINERDLKVFKLFCESLGAVSATVQLSDMESRRDVFERLGTPIFGAPVVTNYSTIPAVLIENRQDNCEKHITARSQQCYEQNVMRLSW
jgi:hypothetical protein